MSVFLTYLSGTQTPYFLGSTVLIVGRDSSVGIVIGYGLDGPGIEFRWGRVSSASVQTGRGAHTASYTMGTGSFPGVERGRCVVLTTHPT
jgi:hypothetical protein